MKTENNSPVPYITDEETGYSIPMIMGGSDGASPTVEGMLEAAQGGEPVEEAGTEIEAPEPQQQPQQQLQTSQEAPPVEDDDEDDEPNFNGQTFLESIEDEEVRARVEPVVKKWDAGVTRRFQELQAELKPYKELGDLQRLAEAQQMWQIINDRPQDVYNALAQALGYAQQQGQQQGVPGQQPLGQGGSGFPQTQQNPSAQGQDVFSGQQQQISQGEPPVTQQQYAQLPPEIQRKIDQQGQITEKLAEVYIQQEKERKQREEDQALDEYLTNLKTEFGDFDEQYVIAKMLQGTPGDKAVKQYHKAVQKAAAEMANKKAPKVMSGGGQIPQENVNVAEMASKDVKDLVAGLIAQGQGET